MTDETTAPDEAHIIEDVAEEQETVQPAKETKVDHIKLLAERNAARAEKARLEKENAELKPLAEKVAKLEEMYVKSQLDQESKQLKDEFYSNRPEAKELQEKIDAIAAEKNLDLESAFKLAAAELKPELLLEAAVLNKNSWWAKLTGVAKPTNTKEPSSAEDYAKMSDADFIKWSEGKAKAERLGSWFVR